MAENQRVTQGYKCSGWWRPLCRVVVLEGCGHGAFFLFPQGGWSTMVEVGDRYIFCGIFQIKPADCPIQVDNRSFCSNGLRKTPSSICFVLGRMLVDVWLLPWQIAIKPPFGEYVYINSNHLKQIYARPLSYNTLGCNKREKPFPAPLTPTSIGS